MDVRFLRNEADYDWALREVERYFDDEPEPGTPEADRFDVLSALIEKYEATHWAIEPAAPIPTLQAFMEARGYGQSDLAAVLGSRSRASEVLSCKRELNKYQIWNLYRDWKIDPLLLIQPYGAGCVVDSALEETRRAETKYLVVRRDFNRPEGGAVYKTVHSRDGRFVPVVKTSAERTDSNS